MARVSHSLPPTDTCTHPLSDSLTLSPTPSRTPTPMKLTNTHAPFLTPRTLFKGGPCGLVRRVFKLVPAHPRAWRAAGATRRRVVGTRCLARLTLGMKAASARSTIGLPEEEHAPQHS